jgi:hypothetical protein
MDDYMEMGMNLEEAAKTASSLPKGANTVGKT